jgi:GNAT superfamily N-acetyltransferase
MFEAVESYFNTPALSMRYHLNPWDELTIGGSAATITSIAVHEQAQAAEDFRLFVEWCDASRVLLVTCRLPHDRLDQCGFLEARGFRFVELNYRPELAHLHQVDLGEDDGVAVEEVGAIDKVRVAEIAGQIFEAGRFHADPLIDPRVGDLRYRQWVLNAFRNPAQRVWKCSEADRITAFFVVEYPEPDRRFWSLVGLAPGLSGKGLGARMWRAMLRKHREEGAARVSTSISSLNVAVLNLYVKLAFRFPPPEITMHWCPRGRILGPVTAA